MMQISADTKAESLIKNYSSFSKFEETALAIFRYQKNSNPLYSKYCEALNRSKPTSLLEIPFLPISLFKKHVVSCADSHEVTFFSSGTTGTNPSKHFVHKLDFYKRSFKEAFQLFYGNPADWTILALLPSYMERSGSSLITMVEDLIQLSGKPENGFFLYEHENLYHQLKENVEQGKKTMLIGVSFALLDFIEKYTLPQNDFLVVMETGGMKGRKKEMVRAELHRELIGGFGTKTIHSEYGMTELLSQAYSKGLSRFNCPPWMRVVIREQDDPLSYTDFGRTGGINVIDFANFHSCSFIGTQDLGRLHADGSFEVLGRFDSSEVRGCNLLVS